MPLRDKEWERAIEKHLLAEGWDVWRALQVKVKRGPMWLNLRADLWGCIDIAAMHPERSFLFVQATTSKGVNERRRKIETHKWPVKRAKVTFLRVVVSPDYVDGLDQRYRVEIWEARAQRSMADSRKWEYGARIHQYHPLTKDWTVAPDIVPIAK